jgi:hypothetical protein
MIWPVATCQGGFQKINMSNFLYERIYRTDAIISRNANNTGTLAKKDASNSSYTSNSSYASSSRTPATAGRQHQKKRWRQYCKDERSWGHFKDKGRQQTIGKACSNSRDANTSRNTSDNTLLSVSCELVLNLALAPS